MLGLKYEDITKRIKEEKGLSDEDIELKVKQKLNQLSDLISKQGAAHIIANELGINLFDGSIAFKVDRLGAGMRNVSIICKVMRLYGINEFKTNKNEGKVCSMLVGDETGVIRMVLWDTNHISKVENNEIKEGVVVKIRNGYIKENNGYKELHVGNLGQIELSDESIEVKEVRADSTRKQIKDLEENDMNVSVMGTIVQLFEPKFFPTCVDCRKKVIGEGDKFRCEEHGVIKPEYVPVLNFFFDDGTENIRCVAFREQANSVLGLEKEKVLELKDDVSGFEEIKNNILGKQVLVVGRIVKNNMFDRIEMIVNRVEDVKAEELVKEMESSV